MTWAQLKLAERGETLGLWTCPVCYERGPEIEMVSDRIEQRCSGDGRLMCRCNPDGGCSCHNHGSVACPGCRDCRGENFKRKPTEE